jgi:hypothetical protein
MAILERLFGSKQRPAGQHRERIERESQRVERQRSKVDTSWVPVESSFVSAIRWKGAAGENGALSVRYSKGFVAVYDVGKTFFDAFLGSPSKGQFVHQYLYRMPYREGGMS